MTRRDSCGKAGTHAGITEHSIAREPVADGVDYLRRQDAEASVPSLFDALADGGVA